MVLTPDPALLQTFVETVQSGSFTGAALRVHRTQAAVSMQIKKLERDLDCRLFDRSSRKIKLTAKGELFYDHARRILRSYHDAMVAFGNQEIKGEIVLGLPSDFAPTYLTIIVARCLDLFPLLRIHIICDSSKRLLAQLADGMIDIAIVTEGEGQSSGIVLSREAPVWTCSRTSKAYLQLPVPIAVFHSGDVFRRYAFEQLERSGRHGRIVLTSPDYAGIKAAVASDVAVAVLFRHSLESHWLILGEEHGFPQLPEISTLLAKGHRQEASFIDGVVDLICAVWGQPPPLPIAGS